MAQVLFPLMGLVAAAVLVRLAQMVIQEVPLRGVLVVLVSNRVLTEQPPIVLAVVQVARTHLLLLAAALEAVARLVTEIQTRRGLMVRLILAVALVEHVGHKTVIRLLLAVLV